jgi:hypothetical protein
LFPFFTPRSVTASCALRSVTTISLPSFVICRCCRKRKGKSRKRAASLPLFQTSPAFSALHSTLSCSLRTGLQRRTNVARRRRLSFLSFALHLMSLVWLLKLVILFLNIRASHDPLRSTARAAKKGGEVEGRSGSGEKERRTARARDKRLREVCTDWIIWVRLPSLREDGGGDPVPSALSLNFRRLLTLLSHRSPTVCWRSSPTRPPDSSCHCTRR